MSNVAIPLCIYHFLVLGTFSFYIECIMHCLNTGTHSTMYPHFRVWSLTSLLSLHPLASLGTRDHYEISIFFFSSHVFVGICGVCLSAPGLLSYPSVRVL